MKNICHIRICLCLVVNFCKIVVHKVSKDIIYDAKLKRYKICIFGSKYLHFEFKFRAKIAWNWNIYIQFIFEPPLCKILYQSITNTERTNIVQFLANFAKIRLFCPKMFYLGNIKPDIIANIFCKVVKFLCVKCYTICSSNINASNIYYFDPKLQILNIFSVASYTTQNKSGIICSIIFVLAILSVCSYFERNGNGIKLSQHYQWACGGTLTNFQDDLNVILENRKIGIFQKFWERLNILKSVTCKLVQ